MKTRIWYLLIIILFVQSCAKESTSPDTDLLAPSNLVIEQIESQNIKLTWQDNSSAEEGFRIDRKVGDNEWEENYVILPAETQYFYDDDLTVQSNYRYRIFAFNEETFSEYIEDEIDFSYSDLQVLNLQYNEQISISPNEPFSFIVQLENEYGELVNGDYEVWFKFLVCPDGMNINNQVFGVGDSLSVMSNNGLAAIVLNAGIQTGTAVIEISVVNLHGNWINIIKNNIIVISSIPEYFNITHGGINSGINLSGGLWRIEIAAMIRDEYGNPVNYGMAVWFSIEDPTNPGNDPDWAVIRAESYIGNENASGDSIAGVAYTYLLFDGSHTNDTLSVRLETGFGDHYETEIVLPIQFPIIDIVAVPIHVDWYGIPNPSPEYQSTEIRVSVRDGQFNPVNNQLVVFSSSLGIPLEPDPPDTGDPYTGLTRIVNGEHGVLNKEVEFFYQECPPPIPSPPGVTTATVNAQILSTNVSAQTTIILRRYVD